MRRVKTRWLTLSGAAQSLGVAFGEHVSSLAIRSALSNADTVYVGDSTVSASTGFPMSVGETLTVEINDPDHLHVFGTAGEIVYLLAVYG